MAGSEAQRPDAWTDDEGQAGREDLRRGLRDEHLRSDDFFNAADFPEVTYESTRLNFNGDALDGVDGTLTLLGVTRPVRLSVTSFKCLPHPFTKKGDVRCRCRDANQAQRSA